MAYAGAVTGAAGALVGTIGNLIKRKVNPPNYVPVDAGKEAGNAIAANQRNLAGAEQLAAGTNAANQRNLLDSLRAAIPGFDKLVSGTSEQIQSQLEGKLPKDVVDQINRQSAAANVASGTAGSGFGRNLTTRDLGLNSLQLVQQGIQNSNQWLANARQNLTAPQFDVSNMFISPAQQIAVTAANNTNQWNVQWLQTQLKAAQSNRNIIGGGFEQFGQSLGGMGSLGGLGFGGGGGGAPSGGAFGGAMAGANIGGMYGG